MSSNLGRAIRKDFPIFSRREKEGPFVYLDSAATSLKPAGMIDAMRDYYEHYSANIMRGVYPIAEKATAVYEDARAAIGSFIGASRAEEIVFVRNATEAINLLARSFVANTLKEGEGILLTEMEHHANLVPWQHIAREKKFRLFFLPCDAQAGELEWDQDAFVSFLKERRIKIVSLTHISNVLGTVNPVRAIADRAHEAGCAVIVDAAQSVGHMPVQVGNLGADFLVCSGHKMLGPTGIGILWGRYDLLAGMPPFLTGGEMVRDVSLTMSTFQDPPWRFEAGTPNIAGAIGLGRAVRYLEEIGMDEIAEHDSTLIGYAYEKFSSLPDIRVLGPLDAAQRRGVLSFTLGNLHAHDIGSFLAEKGIMIRVGDHCAKPLHKKLGLTASARISVYLYNEEQEIDMAARALKEMSDLFTR